MPDTPDVPILEAMSLASMLSLKDEPAKLHRFLAVSGLEPECFSDHGARLVAVECVTGEPPPMTVKPQAERARQRARDYISGVFAAVADDETGEEVVCPALDKSVAAFCANTLQAAKMLARQSGHAAERKVFIATCLRAAKMVQSGEWSDIEAARVVEEACAALKAGK